MLELPLTAKIVPIVVAGVIALTPLNTAQVLEAAKNKVVTVVKKEGYVTTIDNNGQQVKLPYEEKVTVERPDPNGKERGLIGKVVHGTIDTCKTIYWWVKK
jgi:hypothetical protein